MINNAYGGVSRSYFYQIISNLIDDQYLIRIDSNTYSTEAKQKFSYPRLDDRIDHILEGYGDYVIWDTNIINKWINHLLNSTITFVEVDKELMHLVANDLKGIGYGHILINPNKEEFYKYLDNQTIVIKPFVKSLVEKDHYISIERMIVELYSNKIINSLFSDGELIDMLNEIFKTYNIDLDKVYHIARRKKIYDGLCSYLKKNIEKRFIYHD